jgi:HK97 family phage major capsid protein
MNRTTLGQMRTILESSSAGRYLFIPSFTAGLPDMLLGLPIRKIHEMALYSVTDALAIALANLTIGYQIVDRIGIRTLRDPFTAKPHVVFYTTKRVGGDVVNFECIKFLKFGS